MNSKFDKFMTASFPYIMGFLLFVAFSGLLFVIFMIIRECLYPCPTFELKKNEWECTSTYEVRRFNGKFWNTYIECSQYSLRNRE